MSEKTKFNHENENQPSAHENEHQTSNQHERGLTRSEQEHGSEKHTDTIKDTIDQHVKTADELSLKNDHVEAREDHGSGTYKQVREVSYNRTMTRTRKKLSAPSRAFSKVVHNPLIDKTSEFAGKTVARPSSMLSGAFFAFIGASALLWITNHYGYEYNYLVAIMMFVFGAIIGLILEFLIKSISRKRQV